ncbi:MAG: SAM-dependent methyltransferase [Candidatus Acetothermia bacterium]
MNIYIWPAVVCVIAFIAWFSWNLTLDALWQPTGVSTIKQMFDLVDLSESDVIYDLGCGDGRVLIEAARERGATGVGLEIDPVRVWLARARAAIAGLQGEVKIKRADMYCHPLNDADVVFLFLSSVANEKLAKKLNDELSPGARILSYYHELPGREPVKVEKNEHDHELFLYKI